MLRMFFVFLFIVTANSDQNLTDSSGVCEDKQCRKVANLILRGLNESVDPCENFLSYACGTHIIRSSPRKIESLSFNRTPIAILQRAILEEDSKPTDSNALQVEKSIYRACMNLQTGLTTFQNIYDLTTVLNSTGGLKVFLPLDDVGLIDTWQEADRIYAKMGFGFAFFDMKIEPLADGSDENTIMLTSPTKRARDYYKSHNRLEDIRFISSKNFTRYLTYPMRKLLPLDVDFERDMTYKKVLQFVADLEMLIMESWEAGREKVKISIADWQNVYDGINRKKGTAKFVKNHWNNSTCRPTSQIDWLETLQDLFTVVNINFNETQIIFVEKKQYFYNLAELLRTTDADTLQAYIHLRFLARVAQYTDVNLAPANNKTRWENCASIMTDIGVPHEYAKRRFAKDRIPISHLINTEIRDYLINQTYESWKDSTLLPLLDEFNETKYILGFEDWVFNDTLVAEYYNDLELSPHFFRNQLHLKQFLLRRRLNRLTNPLQRPYITFVNQFTGFREILSLPNITVFPAGFYNERLFSFLGSKLPTPVNYGGYAFDVGMMWSSLLLKLDEYTNKPIIDKDLKKCFSKQIPEATKIDNSILLYSRSLQTAMTIFNKKCNGEEQMKLKGLEKFSDGQLFFLSFANDVCTTGSPNDAKNVNYVLSNLKEFTSTFQCRKKSNMNRKRKCLSS